MASSTLKWLLIFSPSGRLQAPHPTLWTIFWSVVWLCSSSSSSSTQKALQYLPFSLFPGWIDWLLFPLAEQECKKARNASSRSLRLLFSSCCCFLSVCLSACRQANCATLFLWVFGTCKRILQASSISIKSLHPGSSHRFLLLLTLRLLQKLLIHLKNTWRRTWRTKVFWWVMGDCFCWISWECFVLLWLLRIHIHIHAGEEEMGWEDNRGSFCRWIQTKTSWVLCMCRFLPSLEQTSSFPSVCLLCAFWKNPTSPCMASLSIKEGGEESLSCWHCRGMMMTMMSGASSWVRAHPSWWQDCESVIHCTWFSKTKSFCAQVYYLLFTPWAPFLLGSSLICTHSATKLEKKVMSARGCRWLVIWESEWFCFPFVEDVDDDVFFWCWVSQLVQPSPPRNGCQFAEFYYVISVWSFSESFWFYMFFASAANPDQSNRVWLMLCCGGGLQAWTTCDGRVGHYTWRRCGCHYCVQACICSCKTLLQYLALCGHKTKHYEN